MDIISYGVANKAGKSEQHTRNDVLGQGVEGSFLHTKDRINKLEEGIQNVVSQADKLIVHDTINIMKAHAQLNAIAKTTRYNMHNMIFDDLLDLSGIDTTKSSGYTHNSTDGSIKNGTIVTLPETADSVPEKAILVAEESSTPLVTETGFEKTGLTFTANTKVNLGSRTQYNFASNPAITIEMWVKPSRAGSYECLFGNAQGAGWGLWIGSSKWLFQLYLNGAYRQVFSDEEIVVGEWTHIAGVYDKKNIKLYVNGELQTSQPAATWAMTNSSQALMIGSNDTIEYFRGNVDDIRLWKVARTQVQIQERMYKTLPDNDRTGLVGYWTFDEEQESVIDKSIYAVTSSLSAGVAYGQGVGFQEVKGTLGTYSISRDDGVTWEPINPDTLFYFTDSISPQGTKLRLKAELPSGTKLLNYALTWA